MPSDEPPNLPARVVEPPRGGNGRWRRSRPTVEWDAEVMERVSRGHSYRRIARDLGYASPASVHEAFGRARRDLVQERAGEAREKALLRIETWREHASTILEAQHPAVSQGHTVWVTRPERNELTGEWIDVPVAPVWDATVNLGALDRLVKLEQEEARLRGTYAPTAAKVTKLTDEQVEDLIAADLAAADDAEASTDLDEQDGPGVGDALDPDR